MALHLLHAGEAAEAPRLPDAATTLSPTFAPAWRLRAEVAGSLGAATRCDFEAMGERERGGGRRPDGGRCAMTYEETVRSWEGIYRATTYVVRDGDARIEIRIGERGHQAVDAILEKHGQKEWAYITAWNPRSEPTPLRENDEAQERLRETLRREGIVFFEGTSEPNDGSAGEGSLFALVGHQRAAALVREFGQNAIVVGGIDREAAVLWYAP